ncbi:C40 family peptidase [Mesonia sp.]|uniref:C40 family peptidase n=1 Tax=Mesonia sp. TaxID=1960830 RepID=UPI003F9B3276
MIKKLLFLVLIVSMASCGSSRKAASGQVKNSNSYKYDPVPEASRVADYALGFQGTRYKYGGTNKRGMDCSGLIYTSFMQEDIELPRVSREMAKEGYKIHTNQVNVGDLLFFKTNKRKRSINHVGLVVEIIPGKVSFIHSTTSRGVIVSSLNEKYWNSAYVMARRLF